jgi:hypothetical protein
MLENIVEGLVFQKGENLNQTSKNKGIFYQPKAEFLSHKNYFFILLNLD